MTATNNRRPPLVRRPWVANTLYDTISRDNVLHADLYAFAPNYFVIDWSLGGKRLLAQDCFKVSNGELERASPPSLATRLYWSRETRELFAPVHAALMRYIRDKAGLHGTISTTTLCHYIVVPDATPWPRGWTNAYRDPARATLPVLPDVL